ncbi:type II secretion system protein GspM [Thiohalomonas denitrificans]|uniref:Type II secretion system protein M n=1 Tax=Thiohalomonas denitrificans TaxID=415747 RepID=A0A1G5QSR1_9GAMM|nr:type II secretion system protein M [Thiohalomonas denitrificans]SCZ64895.1 general secretion pathway protein M [Thiohalomonas denitrificans]
MKQFMQNLQPRERRTLLAGAIALALLLLYVMVWEPYRTHIAQLEKDVAEQRATLAWMRQAAAEIKELRGSASRPVTKTSSLLATTDRTARSHGFSGALKRIQPDGQRSVRVWLENAPFDDVMRWLGTLMEQHGVSISSLVVDPGESAGLVDARLVLEERT